MPYSNAENIKNHSFFILSENQLVFRVRHRMETSQSELIEGL